MRVSPRDIEIERLAQRMRRHVVMTIVEHGDGHAGPSLSCTDILAVLYGAVLRHDPRQPHWRDRDRLIVSAGHKCLALYAGLVEAGYVQAEMLDTYNALGTPMPAHPDMKKLPGVEFSTGSLGHGLAVACGMAWAARHEGRDSRHYVLMGDGEQGEGSVWESVSFAAAKRLSNVVAVLDRNGLQINGTTAQVCSTDRLEDRYSAFGWDVEVVDGHHVPSLRTALGRPPSAGRPRVVICDTVKGRGLPFAENDVRYHHWNPGPAEAAAAVAALRARDRELGIGR